MNGIVVRYAIASRTATYWNLYVAQQEGFYAAEGLTVEVQETGGTIQTVDAIREGRADLAGCSPDEVIAAWQRGADMVVIGGIVHRPVSWVVSSPNVTRVEQLRGKRVGVNQTRGSVSMVLRAALAEEGLGLGDYEQVSVGPTPAMAAALREERIQAAMLTAPFDVDLVQAGFTALLNVGDLFPRYAFTTINARRSWVSEHDEALVAFFRATKAAGALIADPTRKDLALQALAEGTGLEGTALERSYEAYRQPGVLPSEGQADPAAVAEVMRQMQREGLLEEPLPGLDDVVLPFTLQVEAYGSWQAGETNLGP